MRKNKLRVSYTTLNMWAGGNYEGCVKAYFKLDQIETKAMIEGKAWHQKWADQLLATKTLPTEFIGEKKFIAPQTELKLVASLGKLIDLVGVIDVYDKPLIIDWKTGKQSSETYASGTQMGVYGVLATLSKLFADRAEIWHYDQYSKKSDMSIVWITDQMLKDSHNWIMTNAGEMMNYFEQNDLWKKFGNETKDCPKCDYLLEHKKGISQKGNNYDAWFCQSNNKEHTIWNN